MQTNEQFLQAIVEEPDNDLPRLIYADWLDEQGDPRGEFIRVQCELAQLDLYDPARKPLEERQDTLFKKHKAKWIKDLKVAAIRNYEFRRGFVEQVTLNAKNHLQNAEALLDQVPTIRGMKINDIKPVIDELIESKWLERIESLNLTAARMGTRRLKRLVRSKHLTNIRELDLTSNGIGMMGFKALMEADTLPSLRKLVLNNLETSTTEGLGEIAQGRLWSQLTGVELSQNDWEDTNFCELAENWPRCGWKQFATTYNRFSHVGLNAFLANGHADELERLSFLHCANLRDEAFTLLAQANLRNLQFLNLMGCEPSPLGLQDLMNSKSLANLRHLGVASESATSEIFAVMADATGMPALETLVLQLDHANVSDLDPLRKSGNLHRLKTLAVSEYFCGPEVFSELKKLLPETNVVDGTHLMYSHYNLI